MGRESTQTVGRNQIQAPTLFSYAAQSKPFTNQSLGVLLAVGAEVCHPFPSFPTGTRLSYGGPAPALGADNSTPTLMRDLTNQSTPYLAVVIGSGLGT